MAWWAVAVPVTVVERAAGFLAAKTRRALARLSRPENGYDYTRGVWASPAQSRHLATTGAMLVQGQ